MDVSSFQMAQGGWGQLGRGPLAGLLRAYNLNLAGALRAISEKSINPRGAWSSSAYYAVNDVVTSAGVVYICTVAHTSTAGLIPPNGNWQKYSANSLSELDATAFSQLSTAYTGVVNAASDNILTESEKQTFIRPIYRQLEAQYQSLAPRATALGVDLSATNTTRVYFRAWATNYGAWNITGDTTIHNEYTTGSTPGRFANWPVNWSSAYGISVGGTYGGFSPTFINVTDNDPSNTSLHYTDIAIQTASVQLTLGVAVCKDTTPGSTRLFAVSFYSYGGAPSFKGGHIALDTSTGVVVGTGNQAGGGPDGYWILDNGDEWIVMINLTTTTGHTTLRTELYPAFGTTSSQGAGSVQGAVGIRKVGLTQYDYQGLGGMFAAGVISQYQKNMEAVAKKISESDAATSYQIDAAPTYTYSHTSTGVPNGDLFITARLKDTSGNIVSADEWKIYMVSGAFNGNTTPGEFAVGSVNNGVASFQLTNMNGANTTIFEWRPRIGVNKWPQRVTITKSFQAPPAPTGGSGGTGGTMPYTAAGSGSLTSTSFVDLTGAVGLVVPTGKSVVRINVQGGTTAGLSTSTAAFKVQRRTSTGPDVWTDIGSLSPNSTSNVSNGEVIDGTIDFYRDDAGLTAGATYFWRVIGQRASGGNCSVYFDAGFTAP
jgi:hypothetical protein